MITEIRLCLCSLVAKCTFVFGSHLSSSCCSWGTKPFLLQEVRFFQIYQSKFTSCPICRILLWVHCQYLAAVQLWVKYICMSFMNICVCVSLTFLCLKLFVSRPVIQILPSFVYWTGRQCGRGIRERLSYEYVYNQAIIVVDWCKRVSFAVVYQYFSQLYLIFPAINYGSPKIAQNSLSGTTL